MNKRTRGVVAVAAVAAVISLGVGGAAVAGGSASSEGESADTPITGSALAKATDAALAATGGGAVTGTEVGDEESTYEVEVTLSDGSQVDVQLDDNFVVVGQKADVGEGSGGDQGHAD
jgi:hypothetical protein